MENKREYLWLVAIVGVFGGLAWFGFRATEFPNVSVMVDADQSTRLSEVRGSNPKLVLALLIPGDPVSNQSVTLLKARHQANEQKATFAALLLTDPANAETFRQAHELPFSVYSLNPTDDPVDYNAIVKALGGWRSRFYGGTVVVLDSKQKIIAKLEGIELEHLDDAIIKKL
jgi:hypothetical protein